MLSLKRNHGFSNHNPIAPVSEPVQARPRKHGAAQKRGTTTKRKRAIPEVDGHFIVPDDAEEEMPLSKRIKVVAANKLKNAAKPKPTTHATPALDHAQKAEELRFRKLKDINKFAEAMKKQGNSQKAVVINSDEDQKLKLEMHESITALPPALSIGRGLVSEFVNEKTRFELQNMHRSKVEVTAGRSQARMEIDPDDEEVKIVYLAQHTKKIPIFPNVFTDLDKIIAAPHAYPNIEVDMRAGEHGVLRLRWFKGGASDFRYKELAEAALVRHNRRSCSKQ